MLIKRDQYLKQLIGFRDTNIIKVVTGIRRCGKSTLFQIYCDYLKSQGVDERQIISINFEDMEYEELTDYHKLYKYVKERLDSSKMNYIFFDEIQNVEYFEKVVDSLYIQSNVDIYLTGSNAYFLSGELATLLSGRYVEISMLPLSFAEYVEAGGSKDNLTSKFAQYQTESSFPGALELSERNKVQEYLSGIYNTIILKDVVARLKIPDVMMLESLCKFMFDNIGNLCSTKKISDTMISSNRKITVHTVEKYINGLTASFVLYRVGRYDIKGKQYLKSGDKYYVADIGLRYMLLGHSNVDLGRVLENIVYLELIRRGYRVFVGKMENENVDFIAEKPEETEYYQVALTVRSADTLKRELRPLDKIDDHNPKVLLTLDDDPLISHNGIKQINAIKWLLGEII